MDLFTGIVHEQYAERWKTWRPEPLPSFRNTPLVFIDLETTGLKWWDGHRPIGAGYYTLDGRHGYIPWGHRGDPANFSEEQVREWARRELRDTQIVNIATSFDVHMFHAWGVDLEAQNCRVTDVAHLAALLDDSRRRFSLEVLCNDLLDGDERKVLDVDGVTIDGSRMADYPAGMIAVRAIADARQVMKLYNKMLPEIKEQSLERVLAVEEDCIYAVCEMERNAQPIDVELLKKWRQQAEQRYLRYLWDVNRETGLNFNPKSSESWEKLLRKRNVVISDRTATGSVSTQWAVLHRVQDNVVQTACKAMKLADLISDYLDKYVKTVGSDGLLRYRLNQLRSDEGGTITGRFSSSAFKIGNETIGANTQQIPDPNKQVEKGHDPEFIIRKLVIPGQGRFLSADAKQIEYRLFAHYARNQRVIDAYKEDPDMSFHKFVHALVQKHVPISYEHQKNVNFMKIYAGGLTKLAIMLGFITENEALALRAKYAPGPVPRNEPALARAREIDDIYARVLPEVGPLLEQATRVARDRGYVTTLLGRRSRFPTKQRLHKALNGVIQGGASDILKLKMIHVHRSRKQIGFIPRMTVHDELTGDSLSDETPRLLKEKLNEQAIELRVPILWDVKTGNNWAEC